jgi:hypothetical protein
MTRPIPLLQPETKATLLPRSESDSFDCMLLIVGIAANPAIINSYVAHEKRSVARTGTFASNTRVASTGSGVDQLQLDEASRLQGFYGRRVL